MGSFPHSPQPATAKAPGMTPRRRRPPGRAEQKRREAWGSMWGQLLKVTAKHLRDERI